MRSFRWGPRGPSLSALVFSVAAVALVCGTLACTRPQPCLDPTNEGICFCPLGLSCHHTCGEATGHCTLGCSQSNPACSVSCKDDCTALCSGAGRCDAVCGDNCNVSCEWVKERCVAVVGTQSRVNCQGAADCDVTCNGNCAVSCPQGRCRVHCGKGADCDLDCGGSTDQERPTACADGSRVCGKAC